MEIVVAVSLGLMMIVAIYGTIDIERQIRKYDRDTRSKEQDSL